MFQQWYPFFTGTFCCFFVGKIKPSVKTAAFLRTAIGIEMPFISESDWRDSSCQFLLAK